MSRFKRSQAKYVTQTHTITNWPAYDTDEAISKRL